MRFTGAIALLPVNRTFNATTHAKTNFETTRTAWLDTRWARARFSLNRTGREGRNDAEGRTMLKTESARAAANFWTPKMRDTKLRALFAAFDMPEEIIRAIEGGREKRSMEMRQRLIEIEQTL
jgi:hypothetical protein